MLKLAPTRVVWIALGFAGCAHGVELEFGPTDFAGAAVAGVGGSGGTFGGPAGPGGSAGSKGSGASVTTTGASGSAGGASAGTGGSTTAAATSGTGGTGGSVPTDAGGAGGTNGGAAVGSGGALVDASADSSGGGGGGGMGGSSGAAGAAGDVRDAQAEPPPACPTCTLKVQYRCFQNGGSVSQLEFGLTVANASSAPVALSTITLRYWYRADATGTQQATRVGSDLAITLNVRQPNPPKTSADAYVEVGFVGAGMLAPGADSGPIQISVRGSTASNFDQTNDYSFQSTGASYVDSTTVTAYTGTRLSWGTEPP